MSSILSASVVGGGLGGRLSLTGLKNSKLYRVAAAADLRPEIRAELEKEYPGIRTFASHQEMLAQCPADVVCVSTYPPSHEPVVLDALKAPGLKGLLVEKPLGDTAASGRRILEAIRARGLPVVVPHGLRVRATPREVVARIQKGEIGELKLIEVQCDKWDLLNAGIHWLDFCLAATGETPVSRVMAAGDVSTRTYRDGMQVETEAVTYVMNAKGTRFVVQTGDDVKINAEGGATLFRLVGTQGFIEFRAWQAPYRILNAEFPSGQTFTPEEFPETAHQLHLENLAAQIARKSPDYALPASSLTALEIIEAAFLAFKHRCQVKFPFAGFIPPADTGWDPGKPYSGTGGGRDGRKLED
jgi:predicted dehydrogenase